MNGAEWMRKLTKKTKVCGKAALTLINMTSVMVDGDRLCCHITNTLLSEIQLSEQYAAQNAHLVKNTKPNRTITKY